LALTAFTPVRCTIAHRAASKRGPFESTKRSAIGQIGSSGSKRRKCCQSVSHRRQCHWCAGMAGIGLLHGIHRERANGIYAKLIGSLAQFEPLPVASIGRAVTDLGLANIWRRLAIFADGTTQFIRRKKRPDSLTRCKAKGFHMHAVMATKAAHEHLRSAEGLPPILAHELFAGKNRGKCPLASRSFLAE